MKRRNALFLSSLLFVVIPSLTSCGKLHIHEFELKNNEDTHWYECSKCQEKLDVNPHKMDINDKCFVCNYKDPLVLTNGSHTMTGLTNYAKTSKTKLVVPDNIYFIDSGAFKNSNITSVVYGENLIGFDEHAFDDSKVDSFTDPKEPYINWKYINGAFYKENLIEVNEALVNNKFYPTLKEAIESATENDVTVTLLKDVKIASGTSIDVKAKITLEPLTNGCTLTNNGDIYIHSSGYLKFPKTITYSGTGNASLILGPTKERCADYTVDAFTSGSLIFDNYETASELNYPNVFYINDFSETKERKANGTKQVTGLLSTTHFVYGVCKMSTDYKSIVGLTDFGQTISELTIENPIEREGDISIAKYGMVEKGRIRIPMPVGQPDINLDLYKQKSNYRYLTIGTGISKIEPYAFSTKTATQLEKVMYKKFAPLICPLTSLKISNSVTEIDDHAFFECAGLDTVYVGEDSGTSKLEIIKSSAFESCYWLKNVDLSKCDSLVTINSYAFANCEELNGVTLPHTRGWNVDGCSYLPEDLSPENVSILIRSTYLSNDWTYNSSTASEYKYAYYNNNEKDSLGYNNKVHYTKTYDEAFNNCPDGGTIRIFDNADINELSLSSGYAFTKSINFVSDKEISLKISSTNQNDNTIYINAGKYVTLNKNFKLSNDVVTVSLKGDGYSNLGSFAVDTEADTSKLTVKYSNDSKGAFTATSSEMTINNKTFNVYGGLNFADNNESTENKTINITGLSNLGKLASNITVNSPITANNYSVKQVNKNAFSNSNNLTEVKIDDSIPILGGYCFSGCKNLITANLGSGVTKLEEGVFYDCAKLESAKLGEPNKLCNIEKKVFDKCPSFKYFNFNGNIKGWKQNGKDITENLADPATAGKLLSKTYCYVAWSK